MAALIAAAPVGVLLRRGSVHERVATVPAPTVAEAAAPLTQPTVAGRAPATATAPPAPVSTTGVVRRPSSPGTTARPSHRHPVAGLASYRGLGTWLDVYTWSASFTNGHPSVGPEDVDRMASAGVQTLYIEASSPRSPPDVLEPERLLPIVERAHQRGLRVVAWYLPTLEDPGHDLARLLAIARLPTDGTAVDIESRDVVDVSERDRRLVRLSAALRHALAGRSLGAIVVPPVVMEAVNPAYWPGFPWRDIAGDYDVWLPMGYWTMRSADSPYREAERYSRENVERLRNDLGQRDAPVHLIGGIGNATTAADVEGFLRAAAAERVMGAGLYEWHTTAGAFWPRLRSLRS
jgi:hypothetical protein